MLEAREEDSVPRFESIFFYLRGWGHVTYDPRSQGKGKAKLKG